MVELDRWHDEAVREAALAILQAVLVSTTGSTLDKGSVRRTESALIRAQTSMSSLT